MTGSGRARSVAASALGIVVVAIAVAGCSASPTATQAPPTGQTAAPANAATPSASRGPFNQSLAYQSAWHVAATSTYVNGSADVCDLNLGISIEDAAAIASADATTPVFGFVALPTGTISYGTVWPTAVTGTGIASGTGTYTISYDASGLPTRGTGTAQLVWHDASKTPATSSRTDTVALTFTQEPRAKYCP